MDPIDYVKEYIHTYDPEYADEREAQDCLDMLRCAVGDALQPYKVTDWTITTAKDSPRPEHELSWYIDDDTVCIGSGTIYGASLHDLALNTAMLFGICRPA